MSRLLLTTVAVAPVFLVLACTDANKLPAEAAMTAAETAVATLGDEASKYAPAGVASIQKNLAAAKDFIAKQDYKGALSTASAIPAEVKQVTAAAAAKKKDEVVEAWYKLSDKLPTMTAAIKSRLATLSKSNKLPTGINKDVLAKASEGVSSLESGYTKASEDFKSGKMSEAIAQAKDLQAKVAEIMKSIGM